MADGGGLLIVVSILPSDITVVSVLIVSSAKAKLPLNRSNAITNKRVISIKTHYPQQVLVQ